jgi:prevent-host-death family protein
MKNTVGLFEAKTKLSEFVERAASGDEITITRRGQPVARLVPAAQQKPREPRKAMHEIRSLFRQSTLPSGYTIRKLIEEGRGI